MHKYHVFRRKMTVFERLHGDRSRSEGGDPLIYLLKSWARRNQLALFWHLLASSGIFWHLLASSGIFWHLQTTFPTSNNFKTTEIKRVSL